MTTPDDRAGAVREALDEELFAWMHRTPGLSEDDRGHLGGRLLRMAQDLLGPEMWSITLEGMFLGSAREILERHERQDEQLGRRA